MAAFKTNCHKTMGEIYAAAAGPTAAAGGNGAATGAVLGGAAAGGSGSGSGLNVDKLRAKALQFFPNIVLDAAEVAAAAAAGGAKVRLFSPYQPPYKPLANPTRR